jgi:hypothetical protein
VYVEHFPRRPYSCIKIEARRLEYTVLIYHLTNFLKINLEKVDERWWEKLLQSEEKIDLKGIHPEKPFAELDEESQAKIKQLMHDEKQKKLGLPTSEEQVNTISSI